MMMSSIPFIVPAQFEAALSLGELVRYGGILKEVSSGRIVAHLQETGMLQSVMQTGLSSSALNPIGAASGLVGMVQNQQIKGRLDAMQAALGGMQSLQLATMVSSVAGIGVTAASTAIILHRFNSVDANLKSVEAKIDSLPSHWRDLQLQVVLADIETQLERLHEVPFRRDSRPIIEKAEAALHSGFNAIHKGLMQVVCDRNVDADLLRALLAGLSLCASAEVKSLLLLNETKAASRRSRSHAEKLQLLAFKMPRDILASRLNAGQSRLASCFLQPIENAA